MTWVPHDWISECCEMCNIANNVQNINVLNNSMKSWKLELNASRDIQKVLSLKIPEF